MKRIAIIGGGLTGLVAARELVREGYEVTVYEAGMEVGGLAACFSMGGEPLEKAYHHLFRTDTDILQLVDALGIGRYLEWKKSSVAIMRDAKLWPFMSPVDLLRFSPCSFVGRIRLGLVALYLKKTKKWRKFVGHTALEWMRTYCGESATTAVWGPLLRGKFSASADKVSMAWLWARLHVRANSREPSGGGERLGYFSGGFVRIADALAKELEACGTSIFLSTPIRSLGHNGSAPTVDVGAGPIAFDAVLFTGSNRVFSRIIPQSSELADYRARLTEIDYLAAACLVFATDQDLSPYYWININEDDAPFLVLIQHTNLVDSGAYGGKNIYYIGAYFSESDYRYASTESELKSLWFSYLKTIFPKFDEQRISECKLFSFRDAQHVVDTNYAEKRLPYESPVPGLFLANFTQIFPEDRGTNFAVREGKNVAAVIASSISR